MAPARPDSAPRVRRYVTAALTSAVPLVPHVPHMPEGAAAWRCEVCRHLLHEGLVVRGLTVCDPCQAKAYAVGGAS